MMNYILDYIKAHKVQLTKFVIVGLITFCINIFSFHVSYGIVQLDYKLAASIAYVISVMSHFFLHRTFTFGAGGQEVVHSLWKYSLMLMLNYMTMLVVLWFFVDILKGSPYMGIIASTAVTAFISFFTMKYFVFQLKYVT